ncbi:50S rRNA methyltransferase [Staphylococcus delphini]|uniref:50S rRNA methyltransferase n=1 Tax=Staphylococcus delphini TaxID=53344 RepID=A0A2A4H004_9STAP|nr:methyltransferase domain-containing protein [Staphylococcus delphini]PCF56752.1 50S rRNA methyltransferase [Staphylococcus delphini]PCF62920.1 50S rRNA methyltransferase [Staphylococcus delphini]PCF72622.1 50S rRNA methyltransferase [Staphylococcus delphini]HEC2157842.1 methyltransferase domain-containing protein [Staphylococcus delphini]
MQGRNDFIERLLESAGIKAGMRVLDVGCATGEVTQIVAKSVGETGEVIGVDMNQNLLDIAENHNHAPNVQFINADLYQLPESLGQFDVIVGRRILMYLPDVPQILTLLKSRLNSKGILCFQESDAINGGVGAESLPEHQQAIQRVWSTIQQEGGDMHIGQKLYKLFLQAGMTDVHVHAEALIQTSDNNDLQWLTEMMLPRMVQHKVVSEDFPLDAWKQAMDREARQHQAAFIRDMPYGIFGRK